MTYWLATPASSFPFLLGVFLLYWTFSSLWNFMVELQLFHGFVECKRTLSLVTGGVASKHGLNIISWPWGTMSPGDRKKLQLVFICCEWCQNKSVQLILFSEVISLNQHLILETYLEPCQFVIAAVSLDVVLHKGLSWFHYLGAYDLNLGCCHWHKTLLDFWIRSDCKLLG